VYILKDEKIIPVLENQEDDKCYYSISWNTNDLYIAGEGSLYKYFRTITQKDKYRIEVRPTIKKLFVNRHLVITEGETGIIPREVDLKDYDKKNFHFVMPPHDEKKDDVYVLFDGTRLICKRADEVKEIDVKEQVYDAKIIEDGYTHNGASFPIRKYV